MDEFLQILKQFSKDYNFKALTADQYKRENTRDSFITAPDYEVLSSLKQQLRKKPMSFYSGKVGNMERKKCQRVCKFKP
ncbi:hypothetical protein CDAR_65101 [Caerostris darwini]|uniref:Uncharacterized protein n=1 Tax=Caerostris darwini TaxID=1538125 RepID=A0AAV4VQ90_9ARAC|nr:hypothetical protein CDAR_65101 [Caerostris darwini]